MRLHRDYFHCNLLGVLMALLFLILDFFLSWHCLKLAFNSESNLFLKSNGITIAKPTYERVASFSDRMTSASSCSSRALYNEFGHDRLFRIEFHTSSSPTLVMSFWMIPSSENRPTQVTSMVPVPFMTDVPESMKGCVSTVFFCSSDSPVKADSSHATSEP